MEKTLTELASLVGGSVIGDDNLIIKNANNVADAIAGEITFAVDRENMEKALASNASAVIVTEVAEEFSSATKSYIVVQNPRLAFVRVVEFFLPRLPIKRVCHDSAVIGRNVSIGEDVAIMANAYVADGAVIGAGTTIYPNVYVGHAAKIGENCVIHANVCVREYCVLGNNVVVNCGAVIGSDGFGFVTDNGQHHKIPHVGNVIIDNDVEIGANVTVDRASTGSTVIGKGTKVDNLVHIAHSVNIGQNCLLVAQTGISGSVNIGNNVTFAGQCGSAGHLTIGDNCVFAARTAVISDIPANSFMSGFPARPHREWLKMQGAAYKVPDLLKRVQVLEKIVNMSKSADDGKK